MSVRRRVSFGGRLDIRSGGCEPLREGPTVGRFVSRNDCRGLSAETGWVATHGTEELGEMRICPVHRYANEGKDQGKTNSTGDAGWRREGGEVMMGIAEGKGVLDTAGHFFVCQPAACLLSRVSSPGLGSWRGPLTLVSDSLVTGAVWHCGSALTGRLCSWSVPVFF